MKALITRKLGMTSVITDDGASLAVTLLKAEPNIITQIKTNDIDGYEAVQMGFEKSKKSSKSQAGHLKNSNASAKVLKEFKLVEPEEIKVGDEVSAENFDVGDVVSVTGVSKGKGFAGTIKRHNFHRGRKTHGGRSYRRPGSIGSMYPQNIRPGKKMAGQMGHERVTVKNVKVALIDNELGVIGISGAIPGPKKGLVLLKGAK